MARRKAMSEEETLMAHMLATGMSHDETEAVTGVMQFMSHLAGQCMTQAVEVTKLIHTGQEAPLDEKQVLKTLENALHTLVNNSPAKTLLESFGNND